MVMVMLTVMMRVMAMVSHSRAHLAPTLLLFLRGYKGMRVMLLATRVLRRGVVVIGQMRRLRLDLALAVLLQRQEWAVGATTIPIATMH